MELLKSLPDPKYTKASPELTELLNDVKSKKKDFIKDLETNREFNNPENLRVTTHAHFRKSLTTTKSTSLVPI